jgi:hypothetical protein
MSKVKNPTAKKQLSLERDRRNVYNENAKASRKNIPKGKQRRKMNERRKIAQVLGQLTGQVEEDVASNAELSIKLTITHSKNRGFEKMPDKPLSEVVRRKMERRQEKGMLGAAKK